MSILAAAEPEGSALGLAVAAFAGVAALAVAALTGLLRPAAIGVGRRVPPDRPLMPLVGVLFAGVVVWLTLPSLYLELGPASPAASHTVPAQRPTTRQMVFMGAVSPALAFVVLAAGNALVRRRVGQRLGLRAENVWRGLLWGVAGIGLALPFVWCVMVFAEWAYKVVGYEHPSAHDLLKAMDGAGDPAVKYLAIIVAVVVAPLWEELLFRGHVQTLIREGLIRMGDAGRPGGFPVIGAAPSPIAGPSGEPLPLLGGEREPAFPMETWVSIVLASLVFASVHQPWQFPPIFALSLCLGFAYERGGGNLWVPVVMHAAFNAIMTAFYLFLRVGVD